MATSGDKKISAGIVGISGYSGMELAKLLSRHPGFELRLAGSDKWAGKKLGDRLSLPRGAGEVVVEAQETMKARLGEVEVVFLCTPPEASIELAPHAVRAGARVVDLSGGFRLPPTDYPRWYGFEHAAPGLLAEAVYSMPEANGDPTRLRTARLVSNPGCYPTASALAVLPLLRAGLVEPGTLVVDAKSGTTGAGRKATEELSFSEVDEDMRAYRVLRHQHTPEIERVLTLAGVSGARVVFTPHLLPVRRGILATAYGRLTASARSLGAGLGDAVKRALSEFAAGRGFLRVVAVDAVTLRASVGTNRVVLGAAADPERDVIVACASIDNLVKGAAGQAVQNANVMFGLDEAAGLDDLTGYAP
jgi:N-acetyl-gamma-glutamyl-phosphate reductase